MDYPDPSNFINVLLDGRRIQADNNVNVSYFNNATYNARMDKAYALAGQARLTAYGLLDRDIMKDHGAGRPVHLDERPLPDQHQGGLLRLHVDPEHAPDPDLHQVETG